MFLTRLAVSHVGGKRWELTDPFADRAGGTLPFFIDWGASPHPAEAGPSGAQLLELRVEHPDAAAVATQLAALGVTPSAETPLLRSPGRLRCAGRPKRLGQRVRQWAHRHPPTAPPSTGEGDLWGIFQRWAR